MGILAKTKKDMDILHGPMIKNILLFSIPLALTSIMQQFFHSVDTAVVGSFCGKNELAAVGSNSSITTLLINMFMAFSAGSNVVIGQLIGANKLKTANKAVHTSLSIAIISGITVAILGVIFSPYLLKLISSPPEIIGLATIYLRIYFLGVPFLMIYNFSAAILRNRGETTKPFFCLLAGGISNIILDIALVTIFDMGVSGVAVATSFSNLISCVLILRILSKEQGTLKVVFKNIKPDKFILYKIFKIGIPMSIQAALFPVSNMMLQSSINSLGTTIIAANSAACSVEAFNYALEGAFLTAVIPFVSQNYGAKNIKRCRQAVRTCALVGLAICCSFSFIMYLFLNPILSLFGTDSNVIYHATYRLIFMYLTLPIAFIMDIISQALKGLGYPVIPTITSILGICGLRMVWLLTVFKAFKSYFTVLLIYPVSWTIVFIFLFIAYRIIIKKLTKQLEYHKKT